MRKIYYNLAGTRKIDTRSFALTAAVLFLAVILFNAFTFFNLARQQRLNREEKKEIRYVALKLEELNQITQRHQNEILSMKKTLKKKLAFANSLIEHKCFSFILRLDFLEKVCSAGMRINQLKIANDLTGRMRMTVNALAQNQLLELYKKLLPYELAITNENQSEENYQVNLSFKIKDEKN
jgi:hypothetical protein